MTLMSQLREMVPQAYFTFFLSICVLLYVFAICLLPSDLSLLPVFRGAGEGDAERPEASGSSHSSRGPSHPQTQRPAGKVRIINITLSTDWIRTTLC